MLKKTITYTDYNGTERTEDFYFNLTQPEVMRMELGENGGLIDRIEKVVAAKDGSEIMRIFEDLIMKSYGEKSPDGRQLIKKPELAEAFSYTPAYESLFMELVYDATAASAFVRGIVPNGESITDEQLLAANVVNMPTN